MKDVEISVTIRVCPQKDGTCLFFQFIDEKLDYEWIEPAKALILLAQVGAQVEFVVDDLEDPEHSQWEAVAVMQLI